MTIQITIIGLGQIGASAGLALAGQGELLRRVGHDKLIDNSRQAEKLGAVDKVELNLHSAVRGADLVLLCLPMDHIRETLAMIALDLKDGAVVMDTGPVKETVSAWAAELLPAGRYYVGLTPVLNPAYLHEAASGIEAVHADLFKGGLMAIVAPPRTSSEAIKLAADLTRLLGADPLFADPVEVDSLMAATHLLPQLAAAALLNATTDQPGWREGRKLAGRAYAEATAPVVQLSEPQTLRAAVLLNREHILRWLDGLIAALQALRSDIAADNQAGLEERLARARRGREQWWHERLTGNFSNGDAAPAVERTSASQLFGRMLGLTPRKPKDAGKSK